MTRSFDEYNIKEFGEKKRETRFDFSHAGERMESSMARWTSFLL
jgi:hypothetical protein